MLIQLITYLILRCAAILPPLTWGFYLFCNQYVHPGIRIANLIIPSIVAAIYVQAAIQTPETFSESVLYLLTQLDIMKYVQIAINRSIPTFTLLIMFNEIYSLIARSTPLRNLSNLLSHEAAITIYLSGAIFYTIAIIRFAIFATPSLPSTIAQIFPQ